MQYAYEVFTVETTICEPTKAPLPARPSRLKPGEVLHVELTNGIPPNRDPGPVKQLATT